MGSWATGRHDGQLPKDCVRRDVLAVFRPIPARLLLSLACGSLLVLHPRVWAQSYVALMDGQRAVPLNGQFNAVPVLHSNQPEEVEGPGLLISTVPGTAVAAENGMPVEMPAYTFDGENKIFSNKIDKNDFTNYLNIEDDSNYQELAKQALEFKVF